jgi:hypothetical protein
VFIPGLISSFWMTFPIIFHLLLATRWRNTTTVLKRGYSMVEVELPPKIHSPNLPKIKNMLPEVRVALVAVFFWY